jgi:hypothetical protein
MATFRYFHDTPTEAVELVYPRPMDNKKFFAQFPSAKGRKYDGYSMWVGNAPGHTLDSQALPVTRVIEYKKHPSLHVCNAKCLGGKVNGACECSCGGKNHGRSNVAH